MLTTLLWIGVGTALYAAVVMALEARGGVFLAANVLFWTWWLNLLLGAFNCIPCYPLDGGNLLRTTVEALGSRVGLERPKRVATAATVGSSGLAAVAILLVLASPLL